MIKRIAYLASLNEWSNLEGTLIEKGYSLSEKRDGDKKITLKDNPKGNVVFYMGFGQVVINIRNSQGNLAKILDSQINSE